MLHLTPDAGLYHSIGSPLQRLNYRLMWDKKFRIALLTLITFIAMC